MSVLAFFAFLSGIVTILSPCILPVLPIILTGSIGGKRKPLGVVTGFIISFSLFTLALSTLVQTLSIPPDILRVAAVIIIVGFGLVLLVPPLQKQFEILASRLVSRKQTKNRTGFGGGLLVGSSLGLLWTPCVGPIMASVISLAVSSRVDGGSVLIILSYSAGTAVPMLGVMLGGRKLIQRFPGLASNTAKIQRIFGAVMLIMGIAIAFNVDRKFQTMVLRAFPNYGTGLTSFENRDFIKEALDERASGLSGNSIDDAGLQFDDPPANARLGYYGDAPELIADGPWFNTNSSLTMDKLKGKVVLLDFWTYSCVNCIRTLPYLSSWHEKYSDNGLVIIGVHSPEFAFERNENNLVKAMDELGVNWPVVMDNDFSQWRSYKNRYWPAHYFIDSRGRIRYFHFGEGAYQDSERVIRKLLEEAGYNPDERIDRNKAEKNYSSTPETYLGYKRAEGFLSEETRKNDSPIVYSFSKEPGTGEWNLDGEWIIRNDFVEIAGSGSLELGFDAKNVFLVIEPLKEGGRIEVLIDGENPGDTPDVISGMLRPDESRMYTIALLPEAGKHILRLNVEGELRLYAFTFG